MDSCTRQGPDRMGKGQAKVAACRGAADDRRDPVKDRCVAGPLPWMALLWHNNGMTRIRVSTTVDEDLLGNARRLRSQLTDAALLDEALGALVARHRATEIDAAYSVYERHPLDEPDEWGDLASFRDSAAAS
jgi:hypothetical protein